MEINEAFDMLESLVLESGNCADSTAFLTIRKLVRDTHETAPNKASAPPICLSCIRRDVSCYPEKMEFVVTCNGWLRALPTVVINKSAF